MTPRGSRALTAIEVLVVLSVLAILAAAGLGTAARRDSAARAARDVATTVRYARWAAVGEGRPVVLLMRADGAIVRTVADGFACDVAQAPTLVWEHRPGVHVSWPRLGVAFAPDGRPRRCDGSGVGNTTLEVVNRAGDRAAVVIAITGRVRWERR